MAAWPSLPCVFLTIAVRVCREGTWWGVDIEKEGVCDCMERGVWEPVMSKINSIGSATEAACLILSIDETVRNPQVRACVRAHGALQQAA
jgi:chaperonin GroEL (HSP60 family)